MKTSNIIPNIVICFLSEKAAVKEAGKFIYKLILFYA